MYCHVKVASVRKLGAQMPLAPQTAPTDSKTTIDKLEDRTEVRSRKDGTSRRRTLLATPDRIHAPWIMRIASLPQFNKRCIFSRTVNSQNRPDSRNVLACPVQLALPRLIALRWERPRTLPQFLLCT
uniref:Uncharacterized protein n=1 Tax=Noctiluca scintillans TaxID=2966 RepID=A0A7S0ZV84_NOCSC|mmetsp:Transcript_1969/g.5577  ORF Transcript_1969/g.5577 Transcript_1969/m.5577 type:complete len:127 (+) Transcript_1969:169-549(+)